MSNEFHIRLEPTEETYDAPVDGKLIPVRIWRGTTGSGIHIEAYVLAITPERHSDGEKLRAELPAYFQRARHRYTIDTSKP